jgi:hypothetical protein
VFTIVAAPQVAPPFHSLIRAAVTNLDGEVGWERGLTYAPETLGGYNALAACSAEVVEHPLTDPPAVVEYEPWLLQVEHPCRSMFGYDGPTVDAELRRALDATESYAIARELWTGEMTRAVQTAGDRDGRNLSLTDGPEVLNGGTPVTPARALGLIEQALGDALRGGRAMIHTAREVLDYLPNLTREGNLLTTRVGDLVVADAGYPGTPPDGEAAADGVGWLIGTGMVAVRRGAVRVDGPEAEVVDLTTNTPLRRIDRPVAATFDRAAHYAVAVTLA